MSTTGPSETVSPTGRWRIVVTGVVIAWVLVVVTLVVAVRVFGLGGVRLVSAERVTVGGGEAGSIVLTADRASGARIVVKGPRGDSSLTLAVDAARGPSVAVQSDNGQTVMELSLTPDGQPAVTLRDRSTGAVGWSVRLDAGGRAVVVPSEVAAVTERGGE
jgi:hypothetical protein